MAGTNRRYHAARDAAALLDFALQLIVLPGNLIKIIVGEFAPLLPQRHMRYDERNDAPPRATRFM
ncbi:hypothetical protein FHX09_003068 [Rhizobium sp. BK538]|nr:hypothetical protein [Rhizobium sp. BK060]MBB4169222.1 hypothetical protein [Rhizobium sp. BK538]